LIEETLEDVPCGLLDAFRHRIQPEHASGNRCIDAGLQGDSCTAVPVVGEPGRGFGDDSVRGREQRSTLQGLKVATHLSVVLVTLHNECDLGASVDERLGHQPGVP